MHERGIIIANVKTRTSQIDIPISDSFSNGYSPLFSYLSLRHHILNEQITTKGTFHCELFPTIHYSGFLSR